jgi:hypothetical protein
MNKKLIAHFLILFLALSCQAAEPNRVWFTEPSSGTVVFNTNTPMPTPAEIAKVDLLSLRLSAETNSLRSGIYIGNPPNTGITNFTILIRGGRILNEVSLAMLNTSTNEIFYYYFWYKKPETTFEINMTDDQGKLLPKTSFGERYCQPPPIIPENTLALEAKRYGLATGHIGIKGDALYSFADSDPLKYIPECFALRKPGNYKYTLVHHIYVAEARKNGSFLKPITFSPVTVDVRVEK